jgi:tripartite-type tricarboxylate transporter receptor subunit TctC
MLFEYLKLLAGIDLLHVPYKGSAQAVLALLAREIDLFAMLPGDALAHGKEGKIRLLAYSGATRSPQAPDVPTFAEVGYPNLGMPSFFASFVPAGTPRDIVAKIDAATQAALASPSVAETLKAAGFEIRALGPDKFKEYLVREREKWGGVVKQAGIKVE